jgi:hypothetical protein
MSTRGKGGRKAQGTGLLPWAGAWVVVEGKGGAALPGAFYGVLGQLQGGGCGMKGDVARGRTKGG